MNRIAILGCVLAGLAASPALGEPLAFGALNGADDFSRSAEVGGCEGFSRQTNSKACPLTRNAFGGLAVNDGTVSLNAAGKIRSIGIVLDDADFETAYRLLAGRYGPATATTPFPTWTAFDEGATIAIRQSGPNTLIAFRYPANDVAAWHSNLNTTLIMALLLVFALTLAIGMFLRRRQKTHRARPAVPRPQPTMRETLERRLREGDLQF